MPYIEDVDCEVCANLNTSFCNLCVHNYDDDFFEELSEEELKERKEQQLQKFKESLLGERLEIHLGDEFKLAFALTHNFTSRDQACPEFWCVYCGNGFLMTSDTHTLAKIKADVPEILVGKHLLNYDHEGVFMAKQYPPFFANGRAQELLDEARSGGTVKTLTKETLDSLVVQYPDEFTPGIVQIEGGPMFQRSFLDRAMAAIEDNEEFTIRYWPREEHKALLIEGKNIECAIMPITL